MPMAQRTVLRDVALSLGAGEVHCLVGPSGCGKTTILRLIAGLEPVQRGRIAIDGEIVAEPGCGSAPEARRVGLMFQDYALFPHLRVLDNVAFGLRGLDGRTRRRRAQELLAQVDLVGPCRELPAHALGRRAAARGAGPGARPAAPADAARRAVLEPRCDAARAGPRRHHRAAARRRHAGAAGHPRRRRGGARRRPHPRHAGRPGAAARHARPSSMRGRRTRSSPASSARSTATRAGSSPARSARRSARSRSTSCPTARRSTC